MAPATAQPLTEPEQRREDRLPLVDSLDGRHFENHSSSARQSGHVLDDVDGRCHLRAHVTHRKPDV
jgi:hypothetical protein